MGATVAGYRITGRLGHGGMGEVFEAVQLSLDRRVALKVLSTRLRSDEGFRERFRREARLQAAMEHPNIVPIFDFGEIEEGLYLAMRLVRGTTLKEAILTRSLEPARTLRLLRPVADAVDHAHETGLIHRDIKPHNILIGAGDHPFLADFGLTKGASDTGLTKTGQFVGSTDYIAPEQIRGEPAGPRSDVYALGAVLYECLTGIVPFPKASDAAVLYGHLQEPPPAVTAYRQDLPAALDDVIRCAMAKEPAHRYGTATAMIEDFEDALGRHHEIAGAPAPGGGRHSGVRTPEGQVPTQQTDVHAPLPDATTIESGRPVPMTAGAGGDPSALRGAATATELDRRTGTGTDATTYETRPWTRRRRFERNEPPGPATRTAADVDVDVDAPAPGRRFRRADRTGPTAHLPEPGGTGAASPVAPAPPAHARPAGRRLPASAIAAIAVPAVLAAVAGFAVGGGDDAATAPPGMRTLTTAGVQVRVPADWQRNRTGARRIEAGLTGPAAVGPAGKADDGLTLGRSTAAMALPPALVGALEAAPGAPQRVRFDAGEGHRYTGLRLRDGGVRLSAYLLPTTRGTAVVLCNAGAAGDASFTASCERAARTLRPVGGTVRPLSPDQDYGEAVAKAVSALDGARGKGRARLAGAGSSRAQRSAAAALASNYTTARKAIARLAPPAGDEAIQRGLQRALGSAAEAYGGLARAAATGRRGDYRAAGRRVRSAEAGVNAALARYERSGYGG